jgi:hypothetical protein
MSRIVIVTLIYHRHKRIYSINLNFKMVIRPKHVAVIE